jgi:hypothetical protein
LINALNDTHLWGDIYDRTLTDIFTVESDIAKTIADTLQAKLILASSGERTRPACRLWRLAKSFLPSVGTYCRDQ